jgi:hypothetical protein
MVSIMWSLGLFFVFVFGGSIFLAVHMQGFGATWAYHLCGMAGVLCDYPNMMAVAAVCAGFAFFLLQSSSA